MVVIKRVLKSEGITHWQLPVFGKALQGLGRLRRPATSTGDDKRLFSGQQHLAQLSQAARIAPSLHRFHARNGTRRDLAHQHIFWQNDHNRAGPAVHGGGKGPCYIFRHAFWIVNALYTLGHTSGAWPEEVEIVNLLKRFAVAKVAAHIAYKQNHRRAVLEGRVDAHRRVGSPRPPRDKTNAWTAAQTPLRVCHISGAAFLAVDHKLNLVSVSMESIQDGQVTFSRHTKCVGDALFYQALDQQMARNLFFHFLSS